LQYIAFFISCLAVWLRMVAYGNLKDEMEYIVLYAFIHQQASEYNCTVYCAPSTIVAYSEYSSNYNVPVQWGENRRQGDSTGSTYRYLSTIVLYNSHTTANRVVLLYYYR
jgi:hypothetical protein